MEYVFRIGGSVYRVRVRSNVKTRNDGRLVLGLCLNVRHDVDREILRFLEEYSSRRGTRTVSETLRSVLVDFIELYRKIGGDANVVELLRKENEELRRMLESCRSDLSGCMETNVRLRTQLEGLRNEVETLRKMLESCNSEVERLKSQHVQVPGMETREYSVVSRSGLTVSRTVYVTAPTIVHDVLNIVSRYVSLSDFSRILEELSLLGIIEVRTR